MNASVIGKKIKTLRESKNISREDFANAVKISLSALSMYETGQRIPRDEVKLRIARFLNTTIEELFYKLSTRFVNLIKILQSTPTQSKLRGRDKVFILEWLMKHPIFTSIAVSLISSVLSALLVCLIVLTRWRVLLRSLSKTLYKWGEEMKNKMIGNYSNEGVLNISATNLQEFESLIKKAKKQADELQDTINQLEFFNFSFKFSTDKDN